MQKGLHSLLKKEQIYVIKEDFDCDSLLKIYYNSFFVVHMSSIMRLLVEDPKERTGTSVFSLACYLSMLVFTIIHVHSRTCFNAPRT